MRTLFLTVSVALFCSLQAPKVQAQQLTVQMVGNAGVLLTDGHSSLLLDLPYESGAFGYMHYDIAGLRPPGAVLAVITHAHRDHFAPEVFMSRSQWRVVGPPSVTRSLPKERVVGGDSVEFGAFIIVPIPTPHTPDHRSYRIRWHNRVLHFVGDTDDATAIPSAPRVDVLFVTPWLECARGATGLPPSWDRAVLYHLQPSGGDRRCGAAEPLAQGASFTLRAQR